MRASPEPMTGIYWLVLCNRQNAVCRDTWEQAKIAYCYENRALLSKLSYRSRQIQKHMNTCPAILFSLSQSESRPIAADEQARATSCGRRPSVPKTKRRNAIFEMKRIKKEPLIINNAKIKHHCRCSCTAHGPSRPGRLRAHTARAARSSPGARKTAPRA